MTLPAEEPLASLARAGGYNQVPVMLGTNRDEMKLLMFGDRGRGRDQDLAAWNAWDDD